MSTNWTGPIGPVTIETSRGDSRVFPCLSSAVKAAARASLRIVERLPAPYVSVSGEILHMPSGREAVLRDECGLVVPSWRVEEELARLGGALRPVYGGPFRLRRFPDYDPERDFRRGPVPGIRRGRRRGRFYRHMKTQGERRDLFGLEVDLEDLEDFPVPVKIRKRRLAIPTLWDDVAKGRRGNGWKVHRGTQWKARVEGGDDGRSSPGNRAWRKNPAGPAP
jgi:hypothetical protein